MSIANPDQIAALLREGLDHYGADEVDSAVAAWRRVLELDPANADARDYIESAGSAVAAPEPAADGSDDRLTRALERASAGAFGEALEGLRGADPDRTLAVEATIDLLRCRLAPEQRDRLADSAVPAPAPDLPAELEFELPADAGFLLSLCDGETDVGTLIALSGMDDFEARYQILRLVDRSALSLRA